MKVLHLNTYKSGGAYRAARRIHEAVTKQGVNSAMLFVQGSSEKDSIAWHWQEKIPHKLFCRMNNAELKKYDVKSYFSTDRHGFDIADLQKCKDADILHFHWISDGMISIKSIRKILQSGKKVVWTMHDMCPFTGGCHYSEECSRYENGCGRCSVLNSKRDADLSARIYKDKAAVYSRGEIQPVGCSRWIAECAGKSGLFRGFNPIAIPNPIDTDVFDVIDKKTARDILNLSLNKKLILFGAIGADGDRRKGFKELCEALKDMSGDDYICIVFGNGSEISGHIGIDTISLGCINDDFHLKCIYNAADVFVCPSLYENLANTVMESLSCGTPVVAFDVGGLKDMIDHRVNGYLAKPYDTKDLAEGIRSCALNDLRNEARECVENRFSYDIIGKKYKELYERVLNSDK